MDKIPNIRHLRVFREVARRQSVSAAAEHEFLSQPAVTQAIAKLEADLGVSLFDRRSNGLFATEIGSIFLRRVDPALEHLRVGAREATRLSLGRKIRGFANFDRLVTAAQLRALVAVADAASYSMAARNIGISQPSIHRATRNLERLSGLKLFEATHEGISSTAAAQVLAQHAKLAFSELRQGFDEIDEHLGQEPGQIVVGTLPLARTFILPTAIDQMVRSTRRIQVRVVDGVYSELLRSLRQGDLDCMIGAMRRPPPVDDIVQEPLFDAPLAIVAASHHPLAGRRSVSLTETLAFPWVAPPRSTPTGTFLFNALEAIAPDEMPVRVVSSSLILIRGLLAAGDYLTIITPQQIRHELQDGSLVRINVKLSGGSRPIGLTYRKDWRPTRMQSWFMEEMRAASRFADTSVDATDPRPPIQKINNAHGV